MSYQTDFFDEFAPLVQAGIKLAGFGWASAILAQMALETGYGISRLAYEDFNFFGMKAGSSWDGPVATYRTQEHGSDGLIYEESASFRKYKDAAAGIAGYFEFLAYPRYANLKTAESPEEYCRRIAADGWATSPTYADNLIDIIGRYNLKQYDQQAAAPEVGAIASTACRVHLREWPTTNARSKRVLGESTEFVIVEIAQMLNGEIWLRSSELGGWVAFYHSSEYLCNIK